MSPEGTSDPRLAELERRWQAEPWSRLFLQLAEEYRRVGRHDDAVEVLENGLRRHPNYLSAQVALGRARLERGDLEAASATLEGVVAKDPAQLVAGKLLIEAYLRRGDAVLARQRLEHYRLLNDGDPEIDHLETRIEALGGGAPGPAGAGEGGEDGGVGEAAAGQKSWASGVEGGESAEAGREAGAGPAGIDGASPGFPGVGAGAGGPAGGTGESGGVAEAAAPVIHEVVLAPGAPVAPFAGLDSPDDRRRYLEALGGEAIFPVEQPPEPEPEDEAVEAVPEAEAGGWQIEPAASEPEEAGWEAETAARADAEPAPGEPAEPAATVTLGQLYLEQRAFAEAERTFAAVLERDPANAAALLGLSEVERARPRPITADDLLRWAARRGGAGAAASGGRTRSAVLRAYLARIREGSGSNVP